VDGVRSQLSQVRRAKLQVALALIASAAAISGCWLLDGNLPHPSASVAETPFVPTAWELRPIVLPGGHENGVIFDVSADGSVIVFRDANVYDPIYVAVGSEVRELVPPAHEQGAPIGSQMFPDGRTLLIGELAHAWLYDIASGAFRLIPDAPEGGSGTYVLTDGRIVALSGSVAKHEFGGVTDSKLWLLDPTTMTYVELETRHDGITMIPMSDAVALVVDRSPEHDNSQWVFYRIDFDGSESLIHQFDGPAPNLALALDGTHLALSKTIGESGTWLVDVATGEEKRISDGFPVSFSPDGLQVAIYFPDGHREAVKLDGSVVTSIASDLVAWIGVP
jgi:hypothetical protein